MTFESCNLGFIGAGNMSRGIINGVLSAGLVAPECVVVSDIDQSQRESLAAAHKIGVFYSNCEVASRADILFLSIKPQVYHAVIAEIKDSVRPNAIVVILAAGESLVSVRAKFGAKDIKLVKVMPNLPAQVNAGMTAICAEDSCPEYAVAQLLAIFNKIGKAEVIPEHLFDAFTAVAGSSPAYVFMMIEAMADAGVKHGLSRSQAIEFSTQAVLGAAMMVQKAGQHPAMLRDSVCTPGGTTIDAVCELEKHGFRDAIIACVDACVQKYRELTS